MINANLHVSLTDMIMSLSQATDIISHAVANHQKRVAYIASSLALEMGMPPESSNRLLLAGAVHDIGALSLAERMEALEFEAKLPDIRFHSAAGAALLRTFPPLADIAPLVEYHHHLFRPGESSSYRLEANLLHLADRVDVLLDHDQPLLWQVAHVCRRVREGAGRMFDPEATAAFLRLAERESFWLDMLPGMLERSLHRLDHTISIDLSLTDLTGFAGLFSQIIDFRSRFTATHSSGVAACAQKLALLQGLSASQAELLKIAGLLHDLGKLAVPTEILEKPAGLTSSEYAVVRSHTFYTYRILETVQGMGELATWAAYHHERLDGNGYPFRRTAHELSLNSRIMAVADVFTAVTEDRPYRAGMDADAVHKVLSKMAQGGALDHCLVELMLDNYREVDLERRRAQAAAEESYRGFHATRLQPSHN